MAKNTLRRLVISILCVVIIFPVLYIGLKFAGVDNYDTVNNNNDRLSLSKTNIKLTSRSKKDFEEIIEYNDAWFSDKSDVYNHKLAKASLFMSLASFSSGNISENWGESGNYNREEKLKKAIRGIGFRNEEFVGYDISLNNIDSKAAFGIAMKKYYVNNAPYNIILIAVRSGGYGCEWTDNFNVGDSTVSYHKGFYDSALKIRDYANEYVKNNCGGEEVKYWICGYSRGAAIANILASIIGNQNQVYAYTFATPNTVAREFNNNHKNIFNIVNPYDPVISLPPSDWGFTKEGITMSFPKRENVKNREIFDNVKKKYFELTGSNPDLFAYSPISDLMNIIISFVNSRDSYKNDFQGVFQDLATSTMTKVKIDGYWKRIDFKRYMSSKFGDKVIQAVSESENCSQYQMLKSLGINIPASLRELDIAMRLHDNEFPEKILLESLTLGTFDGVNTLTDSSAFANLALGHYPEVYVSWMNVILEEEFEIINHKS